MTRVSQIDLVPTLSLLMGVPIPFSNLGAVITDLLHTGSNEAEANQRLIAALTANKDQVSTYLHSYEQVSIRSLRRSLCSV